MQVYWQRMKTLGLSALATRRELSVENQRLTRRASFSLK